MDVQVVLMAGGSGTRLWPLSRAMYPKQFLSFDGQHATLFQRSLKRLMRVTLPSMRQLKPVILGNEHHRFLVVDQLREMSVDASLLVEPVGRNTAPAVTLAALAAEEAGTDPILIVSPADQAIQDDVAFEKALTTALLQAHEGHVCTLGIVPNRPETGYGYIQACKGDGAALGVQAFVEKPDLETAKAYLAQGGYYWNAGIFVLKASVWLKLLRQFRMDIAESVQAAWEGRVLDAGFVRPAQNAFEMVPSESIDYAVMEPLSLVQEQTGVQLKVVPLSAGWSDLGAWDAIWQELPKDEQQNAVVGDVWLEQASGNMVHAQTRPVAVVGVSDLVVVDTADAVLVLNKNQSQQVKQIVNQLNESKRPEAEWHRKVHRPWGWYDSIEEDTRFKVKRIQVKPGASLSLQMHHHRAEHWIVVSGTAEVTCGKKTVLLSENQSIYIPLGEVHRLHNPGKLPLDLIEVQSGSYLGEDDIVRFEDSYGRVAE